MLDFLRNNGYLEETEDGFKVKDSDLKEEILELQEEKEEIMKTSSDLAFSIGLEVLKWIRQTVELDERESEIDERLKELLLKSSGSIESSHDIKIDTDEETVKYIETEESDND